MHFQEDPVVEPPRPWWRKLLDVLQNYAVIIGIGHAYFSVRRDVHVDVISAFCRSKAVGSGARLPAPS
jgi:hypothetical protein